MTTTTYPARKINGLTVGCDECDDLATYRHESQSSRTVGFDVHWLCTRHEWSRGVEQAKADFAALSEADVLARWEAMVEQQDGDFAKGYVGALGHFLDEAGI